MNMPSEKSANMMTEQQQCLRLNIQQILYWFFMTTYTTNRGTATTKSNVPASGNAVSTAVKVGKNETLTINRGTSTIKVKDIPAVAQPQLRGQKLTVNRGTGVKTL